MKHLLNDMPDWERNSIREQHEGGMKIDVSRFKKLMETKLGDAKPLINEGDPYGSTPQVNKPGVTIDLPKDAIIPVINNKGIYEKDDESLVLFKSNERGNKGDVIYDFKLSDFPDYSKITNTLNTGYAKDQKTWERISDSQVKLHS